MPRRTVAERVAKNKRILDDVDAMDPDDPSLAPFKTKNWTNKGWPLGKAMGPLFKSLPLVALLALGGCAQGWLADWAPGGGPHSTTFTRDGAVRTYHYPAPDPLGSVHEFRPGIYHRFYGPH